MGNGAIVVGLVIPVALFCPKAIEAGELLIAPVVFAIHNLLGNDLCPIWRARHFNLSAYRGNECDLGCEEVLRISKLAIESSALGKIDLWSYADFGD